MCLGTIGKLPHEPHGVRVIGVCGHRTIESVNAVNIETNLNQVRTYLRDIDMQTYFLAAAIVITFVGIIHSVFGEILIFRKLRKSGIIPKESAPPLQARNVRILWATWHLASAFGFGLAGILLSISSKNSMPDQTIVNALLFAFAAGSALVLIATKGKHPGWIGLMAVAVLVYLGSIQQ